MLRISKLFSKRDSERTFQTNHRIYVLLLVGFVAIALFSLCISMSSPWFTIVAGLGCGGFASVLVAWLIDISNNYAANRKAMVYRKVALSELRNAFFTGGQLFIFQCEALDQTCINQAYAWDEWISKAHTLATNSPQEMQLFSSNFKVFVQDVTDNAKSLSLQLTQLLSNGIVVESDCSAIHTISSLGAYIENQSSLFPPDLFFNKVPEYVKMLKACLNGGVFTQDISTQKIKSLLSQEVS